MGMVSNVAEILAALSAALECGPLEADEKGRVLIVNGFDRVSARGALHGRGW